MKILVVDDDRAVRTSIRLILSGKGFDVLEAQDGAAFMQQAKSAGISAVLVDLIMPDVDGFTIIAQVGRMLGPVPVIAMSGSFPRAGSCQPEEFRIARELGATAILRKPFRPAELLATINQALDRGADARGASV